MAALNKITTESNSGISESARAFQGRARILNHFREKLSADLSAMESKGQIRNARETLDMMATILDHRLL